jgi:hypothetical protein
MIRRLELAKAFHDGPLGADDHEFDPNSSQGKWCIDVVNFFLDRSPSIDWQDGDLLRKLEKQIGGDPEKYTAMITVAEANMAAAHIRKLREEVALLMDRCEDKVADSGPVEMTEGWQDIATAPKDGSVILAVTIEAQSPGVRVSWWDEDGWVTVWKPAKFVVSGPHRWWPTHWQPMPRPPALTAALNLGRS